MNIRRIVMVGGPAAGKSVILESLTERFQGILHPIKEAATHIIETSGLTPPFSGEDLHRFQRLVAEVQHEWESQGLEVARAASMRGLLCDRGRLDGQAYLPGGRQQWEELIGTTHADEVARYSLVIVFGMPDEAQYNRVKASNPARSESYSEAAALAERLYEAWSAHPHLHHVPYIPILDRLAWVESLIWDHLDR